MKPSIPKGTRDFSPVEMAKRNYIFNTIKEVYALYGFQQIETPAMENLSTLMGKYGEEGDKLLFRIQNSGEKASLAPEKGLRYDLTVPFARYVVMHRDEISFPFKRYQLQPVWRADRPQKGRYREFYQCDADVVGSDSLLNEVELMQIIDTVFHKFGIRVAIKINNRKILSGIAEVIGQADKIVDITVAIDKLDKIGRENVNKELEADGIPQDAIEKLQPLFEIGSLPLQDRLGRIKEMLHDSEIGQKGIEETEYIINKFNELTAKSQKPTANILDFDLTLARGLNYYTGAIFEVKALDAEMGSITGGGRYDNLTGIFGLKNMSGVGISYGAERIYDVLNELNLFPDEILTPIKAIFINFGKDDEKYALAGLRQLRNAGIPSEIYPDSAKIGKQMSYANAKAIPFVIMAGENERNSSTYTLKNMGTGEQQQLPIEKIIETLQ